MDVLVDGVDSLLFGLKYDVMGQFGFKGMEEALCDGVVVTVPFCAHALDHTIVVEFIFELIGSILTSPIGVKDGSV